MSSAQKGSLVTKVNHLAGGWGGGDRRQAQDSHSRTGHGARAGGGGGVSPVKPVSTVFILRPRSQRRARPRPRQHTRPWSVSCRAILKSRCTESQMPAAVPPPRVACATLPSPTPRPRHRPQYTLYTAVSTFRSSIYSGFQSILRSSPFTTLSRLSGRLGAARLRSANLPSLSPPRIYPVFLSSVWAVR